jgi:hypothetical protein
VLFSTGLEILKAFLHRGDSDDVFEYVLSAQLITIINMICYGHSFIDWIIFYVIQQRRAASHSHVSAV